MLAWDERSRRSLESTRGRHHGKLNRLLVFVRQLDWPRDRLLFQYWTKQLGIRLGTQLLRANVFCFKKHYVVRYKIQSNAVFIFQLYRCASTQRRGSCPQMREGSNTNILYGRWSFLYDAKRGEKRKRNDDFIMHLLLSPGQSCRCCWEASLRLGPGERRGGRASQFAPQSIRHSAGWCIIKFPGDYKVRWPSVHPANPWLFKLHRALSSTTQ